MTNEELAVAIKGGQKELLPVLWEQVERLTRMKARKFFYAHRSSCDRAGVDADDLEQCGYLAMVEAVRYFDPAAGFLLNTFLHYTLKTQYAQSIGIRTKEKCPLDRSISGDAPLPGTQEDGGLALFDTLEDETSRDAFDAVDERLSNAALHDALEHCMEQALTQRDHGLVSGYYYGGKNLRQLAQENGVSASYEASLLRGAYRKLRGSVFCKKQLQPFLTRAAETLAYQSTGLSSFRRKGCSSVELAAERLISIEDRVTRQAEQKAAQPKTKMRSVLEHGALWFSLADVCAISGESTAQVKKRISPGNLRSVSFPPNGETIPAVSEDGLLEAI